MGGKLVPINSPPTTHIYSHLLIYYLLLAACCLLTS